MAAILYPPPAPQSVGEILDTAFRIFRATLVKCLPYALIAVIAGQLASGYYLLTGHALLQLRDPLSDSVNGLWYFLATGHGPAAVGPMVRDPIWWALYVVGCLAVIAFWSAIPLRQYAIATGHPVAMRDELGTAVRRVPAVLLLFLLTALLVHIPVLPALALQGGVRLWGLIVLAIPASLIAIALSCGWATLLVTGRGVVASLRHSWLLTSGSWWRLALIYSVALVLVLVFYALFGFVCSIVALLLAGGDLAAITAITAMLVVALGAITIPFSWALMLAVLGDLSVRREGADLAQRLDAPTAR